MNHRYCAEYGKLKLRPLHLCDIERLRIWRNDAEISRYLSPVPYISMEMQKQWYQDYLTDDSILFFAVTEKAEERVIGTAALYDFREQSCEAGKIVIGDKTKKGQGFGCHSLLALLWIGIAELGIKKFRLQVCEDNTAARHMYLKAGFTETGRHPFIRGGSELCMEMTDTQFWQYHKIQDDIHIYLEGKPDGGQEKICIT